MATTFETGKELAGKRGGMVRELVKKIREDGDVKVGLRTLVYMYHRWGGEWKKQLGGDERLLSAYSDALEEAIDLVQAMIKKKYGVEVGVSFEDLIRDTRFEINVMTTDHGRYTVQFVDNKTGKAYTLFTFSL